MKIILAQRYHEGGCVWALGLIFFSCTQFWIEWLVFSFSGLDKKEKNCDFKANGVTSWMSARLYSSKPCILMDPHDSLITEGLWFHLQMIRIKIMYAFMWLFKSLIIVMMVLFYLNLNVHFLKCDFLLCLWYLSQDSTSIEELLNSKYSDHIVVQQHCIQLHSITTEV